MLFAMLASFLVIILALKIVFDIESTKGTMVELFSIDILKRQHIFFDMSEEEMQKTCGVMA